MGALMAGRKPHRASVQSLINRSGRASANESLSVYSIADPNSPTLLRTDFPFHATFLHNHLFNSFDEFLSAKLPDVTSQLNSPVVDNPPLFSYFSKPHPCLPTPESRTHALRIC